MPKSGRFTGRYFVEPGWNTLRILTIAGMWLIRIPATALLATMFNASIRTVWSVMILDWLVRMSLLLWRYRKQRWERLDL